jgi:hypothetical protein
MSRSHARDRARPSGGAPQMSLAARLKAITSWSALWVGEPGSITIGTGVSQWSDSSGNDLHATQGTGASQPAWTATSATKGYVQGNGSQGLLCSSASLAFLHSGAGATIVAVLEQAGTVDNYLCGNQTGTNASLGFSLARRTAPSIGIYAGSSVLVAGALTLGADGASHRLIATYRSGVDPDLVAQSDGSAAGTSNELNTPTASATATQFGICWGGGGVFGTTGKIYLLALAPSVLSGAQISAIDALLAAWV